MFPDRIQTRDPELDRDAALRRRRRGERRFEALYVQSFIEMRARNPKR